MRKVQFFVLYAILTSKKIQAPVRYLLIIKSLLKRSLLQETPHILHLKQKMFKFSGRHFLLLNLLEMIYLLKIAWFACTFQKSK